MNKFRCLYDLSLTCLSIDLLIAMKEWEQDEVNGSLAQIARIDFANEGAGMEFELQLLALFAFLDDLRSL